MDSVYSSYMPGYTGHIPKINKTEVINKIEHSKHIPGYAGYVPSIKAENKFGESYGKSTFQSINKQIEKGSDIGSDKRYTSTMRESFINQRQVKIQSTAELLGVSNRKDLYKKPIPINTINKFWGVNNNNNNNSNNNEDEILKKQSEEQNYKNFWSFIDSNKLTTINKPDTQLEINNNIFWGINKQIQELHPGK